MPNGYVAAADQAVNVGVGTAPGQGDSDSLTFVDEVVRGRIDIHKTGVGGAALGGATFILYVNNSPLASRGLEDTATAKTCTTDRTSGDCSITGVLPGEYWLVESTAPAGYDKAADERVSMPLGSQPGQGATVAVTIADPVAPGTVNIHKTGLNGTALGGATFTLYVNNPGLAAPRGQRGHDPRDEGVHDRRRRQLQHPERRLG